MSNETSLTPDEIAGTELAPAQLGEIAFSTGLSATGTVNAASGWNASTGLPITFAGQETAHKWGGGTAGTPGSVTYYFDPNSGFSTSDVAIYRASMQLWSDESGITFTETTNPADAQLRLYRFGTPTPGTIIDNGAYVSAGYVPATPGGTTIAATQSQVMSIENVGSWSQLGSFTYSGGYGVSTVVHEFGHVLGLMHTGAYNGNSNALLQQLTPYDNRTWSIMSYLRPTQVRCRSQRRAS